MIYNRCGNGGLKLPAVSLGMWHGFGEDASYDVMREIFLKAFESGITSFDLANNYGPPYGAAESSFGRLMAEFMDHRDEIVVSTKAGFDMWDGPYGDHGSRKYLLASLDRSLKRMKLDYVDIFYHHRPDPATPLEETCAALDAAVRAGKALYVGVSNYNKEQTDAAYKIFKRLHTPFIVNQSRYSLLDRKIERTGLKAYTSEKGVGLVTFSPLAQGILSGKYLDGIPKDSRVMTDGKHLRAEDVTNPSVTAKIRALSRIASERGQTLAQTAIAWVLKDKDITSVILGATRVGQLEENLAALDNTSFSDEEMKQINETIINN